MNLTALNDTTDTILGIGGVATLLVGLWFKWLGPKWQAKSQKWNQAIDSLVGRDAIIDSITGEERVPALPGMGVRQAKTEQQLELLTTTVAKLVDQEAAIAEIRTLVLQNTHNIALLQAAAVERVASKVEQTEMWKTMQRIKDEDPTLDGDVVDDPSRDE